MNRPESSLEGRHQLDSITQVYLARIGSESGAFRTESIERRMELLLQPDLLEQRISTTLAQLKPFAKTPNTATNPGVRKGWKVLRSFVKESAPILRRQEAVVLVAGSLVYDDPKNLDYDLDIITLKENPIMTTIDHLWQPTLNESWKKIGSEGHIGYTNLELLKTHCGSLKQERRDYVQEMGEIMALDFSIASSIFNGYPLFTPDAHSHGSQQNSALLKFMRETMLTLSRLTPIMATEILLDLEECLSIRRERAALSE